MVEPNRFDAVAAAISPADLDDLERLLGKSLPEAFKQHYLRFNGGAPANTRVPGDAVWEPTDVAMFFSIRNPLPGLDSGSELLQHFHAMRAKDLIPPHFLPFAWDPGGNFFGLDLRDMKVAYYLMDSHDPGLGNIENQNRAQRTVANSFEQFLDSLEPDTEWNW